MCFITVDATGLKPQDCSAKLLRFDSQLARKVVFLRRRYKFSSSAYGSSVNELNTQKTCATCTSMSFSASVAECLNFEDRRQNPLTSGQDSLEALHESVLLGSAGHHTQLEQPALCSQAACGTCTHHRAHPCLQHRSRYCGMPMDKGLFGLWLWALWPPEASPEPSTDL